MGNRLARQNSCESPRHGNRDNAPVAIRASDKEDAPVITAASNGQDEILKTFLKSRLARARVKHEDLNKALCMAAWHGHDICLEMLIEAGAEVNVVYQSFTPLESAAAKGFVRCMKLLIKAGADVNKRGYFDEREGWPDYLRFTPLMSAVGGFNQETAIDWVRLLLRENVQINHVNKRGQNTLTSLLMYSMQSLPYDKTMVMLLYAAGEKVDGTRIVSSECSVPDYLLLEDLKMCLKHMCREAIRKHLLELDSHQHLFGGVSKLRLATSLTDYLVYDMSIEK